jgi:hypothetical protein
MKLKLWAIVIVSSAHGGNSSKWLPFLMISEVEQRIRLSERRA